METQSLIESLASGLEPVKPVRPRNGVTLTLVITLALSLVVIALFGARSDIMAGEPDPIVVVRGALLVLLGLATSIAAANAARPSVGAGHNGWLWALAAALTMPFAALVLFAYHLITATPFAEGDMNFSAYRYCFGITSTSALMIGTALTAWLRRGAPTDLVRAGWLVGLASGGFGAFAYSLHCPSSSIYYIGLVYSLAIGLCAVIGRLAVPRFIHW